MKTIILNKKTIDTFIPQIGQVFYDKLNEVELTCKESKSGLCNGCWYYDTIHVKSSIVCLGNCQPSNRNDGYSVIYTKQANNLTEDQCK